MKRFKELDKTMRVKYIVAVLLAAVVLCALLLSGCSGEDDSISGCASCQRSCKNCQSEMTGGLNRTVNVYAYDGTLIATYTGRVDIEDNETKVLFDLDGKRYIYYNAIVEIIER